MKKKDNGFKAIICLAVATVVVAASSIALSQMEGGNAVQGKYKDGTYTAEAAPDESGNYAFVTVTVKNGEIASVVWDEMYGGRLKSELCDAGEYVMYGESTLTWKGQAEAMSAYVVEKQSTEGAMNMSDRYGYTDTVSGVSIYVGGFVGLVEEALADAENK